MSEPAVEQAPTTHYPQRTVYSPADEQTVTVEILCLYDGNLISYNDFVAETASDNAANDWGIHAPDVPL